MSEKEKMKDEVKVQSRVTAQLIDRKTGKVVQEETISNLITDVGENMLCYWTKGDITTKGYVTHMSLSDETADPAETETTESGTNIGPRKTTTGTIVASKITFTTTWLENEANYTIRRAYLFSAETGGNLYATSKFATPFTKTSDYTFKVNWEITYE